MRVPLHRSPCFPAACAQEQPCASPLDVLGLTTINTFGNLHVEDEHVEGEIHGLALAADGHGDAITAVRLDTGGAQDHLLVQHARQRSRAHELRCNRRCPRIRAGDAWTSPQLGPGAREPGRLIDLDEMGTPSVTLDGQRSRWRSPRRLAR